MNYNVSSYPKIYDQDLYEKIYNKKEFYDNRIDVEQPGYKCLTQYQSFLKNYMSILTNYNSILINHQVGLGKTISAISIAENLKDHYNIVILAKNDLLLKNFKDSIIGKCSEYLTDTERLILEKKGEDPEKEAIKNRIKTKINSKYSFYKYNDIEKYNLKNLSNKVVIIDEAHNITGNSFYNILINIFKVSVNFKLVLLTATPVFDNILEFFHMTNLLLSVDKDILLPDTISKLLKSGYIERESEDKLESKDKTLLENTFYDSEKRFILTQKSKKILKEKLYGKTSFLISDYKHFAKKVFNGSPIFNKKDTPFNLVVTKSYMSGFQSKKYKNFFKDPGVLYKNLSDSSTIVFPDPKGSKEIKGNSYLKRENIKKYSCKISKILEIIKNSPGIIFIFSNYVEKSGTKLLSDALLQNGYSKFGSRIEGKKIAVFDGTITLKRKEKLLKEINDPKNKNGDYIKIIIGSPSVSEGISFKNIRQIHILEPYWNLSRIDQIIGRGIRYKSHENLKEKDRRVDIFLHVAIFDKKNEDSSIDIFKYKISQKKDFLIKNIEHIIKKVSIDCKLNKKRNKIDNSFDFTRDCQYKKCDYTCSFTSNKSSKNKPDISTYNGKIHSKEEYSFIKKSIKLFYEKNIITSIDILVEFIKNNEFNIYKTNSISNENIYIVLYDLVTSHEEIKNKKGIICNIIHVSDYFILNPIDNKISESFYKKIF